MSAVRWAGVSQRCQALAPRHCSPFAAMSHLFKALEPKSSYVDRQFRGTFEEYQQALAVSTTIYVGNLSFFTTEEYFLHVITQYKDNIASC